MSKMSLLEKEVLNHVGEVVLVYDEKYNLIWHHPYDEVFTSKDSDNLQPGIIIDYNNNDGKRLATFIISASEDSDLSITNKLYEKKMDVKTCNLYMGEVDQKAKEMFCECIQLLIHEDVTLWGQAQFNEPYITFMNNLRDVYSFTYNHDCGIHPAGDYGYST